MGIASWWNFSHLIDFVCPDLWGNDPIFTCKWVGWTTNWQQWFQAWTLNVVLPGFCKNMFSLGLAINQWNLISSRRHLSPNLLIIILKTDSFFQVVPRFRFCQGCFFQIACSIVNVVKTWRFQLLHLSPVAKVLLGRFKLLDSGLWKSQPSFAEFPSFFSKLSVGWQWFPANPY